MDVEGVSLPPAFHPRPGKPALLWVDWKYSSENNLSAMDGDKFSDLRRGALLLHCIGVEAQCIYRSLPITVKLKDETDYMHTFRQLFGFYEPKVNMFAEQYTFRQQKQSSTESTTECMAASSVLD